MSGGMPVGSVSSLEPVHNQTHTVETPQEGETSEHVHGSGVGTGQNNNDTPVENEERPRQQRPPLNRKDTTENLLKSTRYTGGRTPIPPNGPSDETIVANVDPADRTMHVTVPDEVSNQELQRLLIDTIQHMFAALNQSFNEMVQHMTVPQFNI